MTTITGNARFREAVAARLVLAMRPNQSIADTAVPDAQSSPSPGNYSIQVDTHQVLLQAHAFDPANLIGPWRASTVFAVGDVIFQTGIDADALLLECTAVAGTEETGATEPTWDTTPGNTTTDNEVTWETLGTISELSPITQFLYQPVLISAVSPETGSVDGDTTITITGSGFAAFDANAGDSVTVGGQAATNAVANSDTEITCVTPAGTEGVVDVVVTIGSESATLSGGFEYTVSAWTPADIALSAWFDAVDSGTITTDGSGNCQQLDDQSGNGRHMTFSSNPEIATDANGQHLVFAGGSMAGELPALGVSGSGNRSMLMGADPGAGSNRGLFTMNVSGGSFSRWTMRQSGSSLRLEIASAGANSSLDSTGEGIFGAILDGTTLGDHTLWRDGVSESISGSATLSTADQNNKVGADAASSNNLLGKFRWLVFADRAFSTEERQKLEGYFAHRHGTAANLAADHPYKNSPP